MHLQMSARYSGDRKHVALIRMQVMTAYEKNRHDCKRGKHDEHRASDHGDPHNVLAPHPPRATQPTGVTMMTTTMMKKNPAKSATSSAMLSCAQDRSNVQAAFVVAFSSSVGSTVCTGC